MADCSTFNVQPMDGGHRTRYGWILDQTQTNQDNIIYQMMEWFKDDSRKSRALQNAERWPFIKRKTILVNYEVINPLHIQNVKGLKPLAILSRDTRL